MSPELIAILSTGATLLVAGFSAFAWMIHRTDRLFERVRGKVDALNEKIDAQGRSLGDKIEAQGSLLGEKIESVQREVVEVKIAVARIEGPRPRFSTAG